MLENISYNQYHTISVATANLAKDHEMRSGCCCCVESCNECFDSKDSLLCYCFVGCCVPLIPCVCYHAQSRAAEAQRISAELDRKWPTFQNFIRESLPNADRYVFRKFYRMSENPDFGYDCVTKTCCCCFCGTNPEYPVRFKIVIEWKSGATGLRPV